MKLSESELKKIEDTIKKIEGMTRGEVVPVLVRQSRDYPEVGWMLICLGALSSGILSYVAHTFWGASWDVGSVEFALEILVGAAAGWAVSLIPAARRWMLGAEDLTAAVSFRASAEFTRHGVMDTQDRCGVLLLVSLFEHRAEILADRGIHSQVPEGYWKECLDRMMAKVKPEGLSSALCSGITELGALLAEKFPREAGSTNELADHLRQDG